jgi:hypothetical protein
LNEQERGATIVEWALVVILIGIIAIGLMSAADEEARQASEPVELPGALEALQAQGF